LQTDAPLSLAQRAARRLLVYAGLLSAFVNLLMLTGPLYMMQVYDRVLASRSFETLAVITALIVALFAAMALLDFARSALLARAGGEFEDTLKDLVFDKAADGALRGAMSAEQPIKDLRQIRQFVGSPALTAIFDAPWTPFFLGIVVLMHWLLGVVAIAGLLALVALAAINERVSRRAFLDAVGAAGEADRLALATFRNAAAADAMGLRRPLKARWLALSQAANDHAVTASDRTSGLTAATKASRMLLQSLILGTGAFLAIRGALSPGAMIAASIIAGRALAPVEIVTGQWKNFLQAGTAYARLKNFLGNAIAPQARTRLPAPEGAIAVDRIFCQPGGAKKPVLKSVSFSLEPGEALGVIGPSAAGKSTLARALVGVERLVSGVIRLDGAELSQWGSEDLGPHIGFLPQEVELFAGTAAANISRFRDDARDEDVIAAAKAAGAHEMILSFADGYDTEIGERGRHLSAGQRQRLGLARALFGNPALVVLDEPNANLDAEGDAALALAIQGLKARRATLVVIAHRPNAIAGVDKLLLLADGEVRAFGPRDEILQQLAPQQVQTLRTKAGG
jgi:PrtD family type I secretion system ABC transporter